jgi:hypothetical protein
VVIFRDAETSWLISTWRFPVKQGMTLRIAFFVLEESCLLTISSLSHLAAVFFSNTERGKLVVIFRDAETSWLISTWRFPVKQGMTLRIAFFVLEESCLLTISSLSHLTEVFFSNTKGEEHGFRWLVGEENRQGINMVKSIIKKSIHLDTCLGIK